MRRISITLLTIVAVLVAASAAAAANAATYSGHFGSSPKRMLSFKLIHKGGTVRLGSLAFAKFPLHCKGGANTETAAVGSKFKPAQPDYPRLRVHAYVTKPHSPKKLSELALVGTVRHHGAKASGTMRVHGRKVPTDKPGSGSADRCDSGKVHWTASRK